MKMVCTLRIAHQTCCRTPQRPTNSRVGGQKSKHKRSKMYRRSTTNDNLQHADNNNNTGHRLPFTQH